MYLFIFYPHIRSFFVFREVMADINTHMWSLIGKDVGFGYEGLCNTTP